MSAGQPPRQAGRRVRVGGAGWEGHGARRIVLLISASSRSRVRGADELSPAAQGR